MIKVDIFSGFLGAGKTTLIKKLISEAYKGEKLVLIENEFGDIGIDGGFMKEAGIQVNELNSGCICCSLTGDFREAIHKIIDQFTPDRIIIEPSGVGKLSDIIAAVLSIEDDRIKLNALTAVVDANKCRMYIKNFGEFFNNQLEYAACIILSRTQAISAEKLDTVIALLREHNSAARIITTPWDLLEGDQILDAIERRDALSAELSELLEHVHEYDDDDECDDPDCECHHHHDDDDDDDDYEHEHHHEHHHHEHEHEHEQHHHHHHHGEHDADEIFTSWGEETAHKFDREVLEKILVALDDTERFGMIVRAKGIVDGGNEWLHFDYTPGEYEIRSGSAEVTGRICVIGAEIKEEAIRDLFLGER